MSDYAGDNLAVGAMVGQAVLKRSVEPHLRPGEELRAVIGARRKGGLVNRWTWNCLEVNPGQDELPKKLAVAATSQRLLVLETGGAMIEEARKLLVDVGLDEVGSIETEKGAASSAATWTARGRRYTLAAKPGEVNLLASALGGSPPTGDAQPESP